jgi:hypothetical protein
LQTGILGTVVVVAVVLLLGFVGSMLKSGGGNGRFDEATAMANIKLAVESRLKSPSSASFPFLDIQFKANADGTYRLDSYVDAQNGFGATIRGQYTAVVDKNGSLKSLELQE